MSLLNDATDKVEAALDDLSKTVESAAAERAAALEAAVEPSFAERHPALVATATVFGGIFALVAVATAAATVGSRVGMIGASKDHPLYKS